MKLSNILEARYSGQKIPLFYYEYYPHYHGTMFRKFQTTVEDIDKFVLELKDDPDVEEEIDERFGDAYAFWEVLAEWPNIRPEIQKNGHWVDMWEEGTHTLSTKSFKHAIELLKQFERENVYHDTDAYEDEDGLEDALAEFPRE